MIEASTAHHGILPPAQREVFEIFLLSAHVQADGDDENEIEEQNCAIDGESAVHVDAYLSMTNYECRMSKRPFFIGKRKVDRLLLKTMLEITAPSAPGLTSR